MSMSMELGQRLEQRLKMTAQMIQSIQMLQLPLMQLQQEINQHLEENPVLEMVEESVEREIGEVEAEDKEGEADNDFEKLDNLSRDEDWSDYLAGESRAPRRYDGEADPKLDAMQNTPAPEPTLRDALRTQLHLMEADPQIEELAEQIIPGINDDGYLQFSLEDMLGGGEPVRADEQEPSDGGVDAEPEPENPRAPVDPAWAEEALRLIQSLDPPGVGARDVAECLLLQLQRGGGEMEFEARLLRDHFDDLLNNRLPKVAKETGTTLERVKEGLEIIAQLNPKPGSVYASGGKNRYVIPDVIVESRDDEYVLRMNDMGTPRLRISDTYRDLMRGEKRGSKTRNYLREKIQSAKWLIDAIEQRRNTLFKIANEIVDIQGDFFERGIGGLKPLMMQEVADRIGMHVSTVSRALTDKYIDTPRGVFPMKYFFTGGFQSADGSAESNRTVMARIQEMVDGEDKGKPLSDHAIAKQLEEAGIGIARRTVAKYREKLGILTSRQRKAY